jgi:hypothetical protein
MRLTGAFFADYAEAIDGKLHVRGGCWLSTLVKAGSTGFQTCFVLLCAAGGDDVGEQHTLHIDALGPTGQKWKPAQSLEFVVPSMMSFMVSPSIGLPMEASGGRHVYTFRLDGHDDSIVLPLQINLAP